MIALRANNASERTTSANSHAKDSQALKSSIPLREFKFSKIKRAATNWAICCEIECRAKYDRQYIRQYSEIRDAWAFLALTIITQAQAQCFAPRVSSAESRHNNNNLQTDRSQMIYIYILWRSELIYWSNAHRKIAAALTANLKTAHYSVAAGWLACLRMCKHEHSREWAHNIPSLLPLFKRKLPLEGVIAKWTTTTTSAEN